MFDRASELFGILSLSILISVLSYCASIGLANYWGAEIFGGYNYAMVVGLLAGQLISFSTDATAAARLQKFGEENALKEILSIRVIGFFVVSILALSGYVFTNNAGVAIGVVAVSCAALNLSFLYEWRGNNIRYSKIYLVERLAYVACVFGLIYFGAAKVYVIFIILMLTASLSFFYQWIDIFGWSCVEFFAAKEKILRLYSDNSYFFINSILTYVYGGFARIIVGEKFGLATLGVYSAAWQFVFIATMFQSQIARIWRRKFALAMADRDAIKIKKEIIGYVVLSSAPVAFAAVACAAFADEIVGRLFSAEYIGAADMLRWLSVYFVVINLDCLAAILWATSESKKDYMTIGAFFAGMALLVMLWFPSGYGATKFICMVPFFHGVAVVCFLTRYFYLALEKND